MVAREYDDESQRAGGHWSDRVLVPGVVARPQLLVPICLRPRCPEYGESVHVDAVRGDAARGDVVILAVTYSRPTILAFALGVVMLVLSTGCSRVVSRLRSTKDSIGDAVRSASENRPKLDLPKINLPQLTKTKEPSHFRNWRPDLMILPYAVIGGDRVHLYNIRDCEYRTEEDYDVRHFDRQVLLSDVRSVDFIVVPFKETPVIAHTMLSFGLADGQHLVFSAEARLEQGESYAALPSANKEYELMWVVGTERDLIRLRTDVRDVDVYLYPTKAKPEEAQKVFLACSARINEIARTPEHYNLITNNCTTNIVEMVNSLRPGYIKPDFRVVLPGHSDRLAYDLGLLAAERPFEVIKAASKINLTAKIHSDSPYFSQAIRNLR